VSPLFTSSLATSVQMTSTCDRSSSEGWTAGAVPVGTVPSTSRSIWSTWM
jgi:hypothetical protein